MTKLIARDESEFDANNDNREDFSRQRRDDDGYATLSIQRRPYILPNRKSPTPKRRRFNHCARPSLAGTFAAITEGLSILHDAGGRLAACGIASLAAFDGQSPCTAEQIRLPVSSFLGWRVFAAMRYA